eukprot:9490477-Pyramimonas_sp.AAC.2
MRGRGPWPDSHIQPVEGPPVTKAPGTFWPPWRGGAGVECAARVDGPSSDLSLIHISEPTRPEPI